MKNSGFKISDLKNVSPDASFKENAKKRFLNSVRATNFSNGNTYKNPIIVPVAFKRIAVSFASFSFVFAVCGSIVYSASDDLPGDFLYPVKITAEKVSFVFTFSQEEKMNLELEIASKRFAEFSQFLDESSSSTLSDPKSKKAVASVVNEIDGSIIRLSNKMDDMHNGKSDSGEVLVAARMIGDKIGEYNKALVDTKNGVVDADVKDTIDKVEMSNNKVAIRALKVAASQLEKDDVSSDREDTMSSVSLRAISKINDIQASVSDDVIWDEMVLEGKKEESVKISERLENAKMLLASADVDLSYALQVVEDIITDHENFLSESKIKDEEENDNIIDDDENKNDEIENDDIILDDEIEIEIGIDEEIENDDIILDDEIEIDEEIENDDITIDDIIDDNNLNEEEIIIDDENEDDDENEIDDGIM
jgi:hypothetical protein